MPIISCFLFHSPSITWFPNLNLLSAHLFSLCILTLSQSSVLHFKLSYISFPFSFVQEKPRILLFSITYESFFAIHVLSFRHRFVHLQGHKLGQRIKRWQGSLYRICGRMGDFSGKDLERNSFLALICGQNRELQEGWHGGSDCQGRCNSQNVDFWPKRSLDGTIQRNIFKTQSQTD